MEEIIHYCTLIRDYERVISYWVTESKFDKALDILNTYCKKKDYEQHFYKFAPVLMQHLPKETVDTLSKKKFLDPAKLIPALMRYMTVHNPKTLEENQVVRYLQVVCQTSNDPAIHNLLVALYAKQHDNPEALINFLTQVSNCVALVTFKIGWKSLWSEICFACLCRESTNRSMCQIV